MVAQLISSHSTIAPGEPFTLGLKLTIDPTWHTYWINPGESGKATSLNLDLPEGFSAGNLQFPVPKRFITDYGFGIREAGFGYEETVIHPLTITPRDDLSVGDTITISGRADFLMCDPASCVPGKAELSISLKVGESAERSPDAAAIEFYETKLPRAVDWPVTVTIEGEDVVVVVDIPEGTIPEGAETSLYPFESRVFDQLADPAFSATDDGLRIATSKHENLFVAPELFAAVLAVETGTGTVGYRISTDGAAEQPASVLSGADGGAESHPDDATVSVTAGDLSGLPFGGGLLGILLAAFIGGIILNIMPCVFPVISLKVMSFVGQSGEDRKKVFAHALTFTLGILVFFWVLTTAMLILRTFGSDDVGWGVQLRQPGFVLGLIFVMVLVAMSLFGVFEIGTSMTGVGGDLANQSGYSGSFWSGALAVLLATPCTAPLMAPAIGFALVQPAPIMFLVFTTLGLGLAAPYFLFAIFPKLLDMIPPPGAWMETFKQFMGFPMLAVAVWLTGVLSKQLDVGGLQWSLAAVLLLALAAWILGRFTGFERSAPTRTRGRIAALLVLLLSLGIAYQSSGRRAPVSAVDIEDIIAMHRSEGKHVFVDFTAEWCVNCKVNERIAIKTDAVQQAFKDNNIEFVIADWTNEDPSITRVLREHGRAGVPLYLLYPADPSAETIMLADGLILPGDIMEAIEKLPK